ncbi:MAG TPA: hypothetical protein VN577_12170 [Terriglobales bacterium]|nr:hypothetical protein [Terriglobales bacterium]
MAKILEMPIRHPARQQNPFKLPVKPSLQLRCPFGCEATFDDHSMLYLHLLGHEAAKREFQKTP